MRCLCPGAQDKPRIYELAERDAQGAVSKHLVHQEVTMLDIFYIAIVIAFFILLWAFTKAAERL
jgi:hypothetical protein